MKNMKTIKNFKQFTNEGLFNFGKNKKNYMSKEEMKRLGYSAASVQIMPSDYINVDGEHEAGYEPVTFDKKYGDIRKFIDDIQEMQFFSQGYKERNFLEMLETMILKKGWNISKIIKETHEADYEPVTFDKEYGDVRKFIYDIQNIDFFDQGYKERNFLEMLESMIKTKKWCFTKI